MHSAVIAKELERRSDASPQVREMLQTLRAQIDVCKHHLTELTRNTGAERIEHCSLRAANDFLSETLTDELKERNPTAEIEIRVNGREVPPQESRRPRICERYRQPV